MSSRLFAVACVFALSACSSATSDPASSGAADSATSAADDAAKQALRDLAAAPGPVVATVPAVSGLPDVARWEIHRAAVGATYAGVSATGDVKVMFLAFIPQPPDRAAPSAGLHVAGSTYSVDDVLDALAADLEAASPTTGITTAAVGLGPLALVSETSIVCPVQDRIALKVIQLTGKIQGLGMEAEDWAGVTRALSQCLRFLGVV